MISRAFDVQDLLHFKVIVAHCLVGANKTVPAKGGSPSLSPAPQQVARTQRPIQDVRPPPQCQRDMVDTHAKLRWQERG